ncbi:DUF2867 domain-containing protein [Duganella sp. LX47W]|uniref:DUF2867 domain-containing protein n=2 Tax=Rugamonas apoptosis TaxID=2758570 RepID=A0A7W2FA00_9BURK|nr:DUF2867 domain-containing protein [Rugamonas apoptosis]
MTPQQHRVTPVAIPSDSGVFRHYAATNLADAYSIELPAGASTDPEVLARFIFSQQAPWIGYLMGIRDAVVGRIGLKTTGGLAALGADGKTGRLGIFKIYVTSPSEIIVGEDDKHLDFRLSVLCSHQPSPEGKRYLTMSTVVHCHNRLGRLYILAIAPFHRLVVQSSLRSAARTGWPSVTPT